MNLDYDIRKGLSDFMDTEKGLLVIGKRIYEVDVFDGYKIIEMKELNGKRVEIYGWLDDN